MSEFVMKIRVLDNLGGFIEELEKNGRVVLFFQGGCTAVVEKIDSDADIVDAFPRLKQGR